MSEKESGQFPWMLVSIGVVGLLAFTGVGLTWMRYPELLRERFAHSDVLSDLGLFGDSYGALNSLFSGLAFAALIVTLLLQMRELHLQRKELDETQEILRFQREEMKAQNRALERQIFEQTFSSLSRALRDAVNEVGFGSNDTIRGTRAISEQFKEFKRRAERHKSSKEKETGQKFDMTVRPNLDDFCIQDPVFGSSFLIPLDTLRSALRYIEVKRPTEPEIYLDNLRAQFPKRARFLLMYYLCDSRDVQKPETKELARLCAKLGFIDDIETEPNEFINPSHFQIWKGYSQQLV